MFKRLITKKTILLRNLEYLRGGGKKAAQRAGLELYEQPIENLYLSWSCSSNDDDYDDINRSRIDRMVLVYLQPHPNLKMLTVSGFGGTKLPMWMGFGHGLRNLVKLYFEKCNTCEHLPALGMLPNLRILQIDGMRSVKSLGEEFYYDPRLVEEEEEEIKNEISVFPSLVELSLIDMWSLEDWAPPPPHSFKSFPSLKMLIVSGCIRLKSIPFTSCSSLESLELRNTTEKSINSIVSGRGFNTSISSLCPLKLFDRHSLTSVPDSTSLTKLRVDDCDEVKESASYHLASLPSRLQALSVC